MGEVIQFPLVDTWYYNSDRLHRYAGSMMDKQEWGIFEAVMTMMELYDEGLIDVSWDPATGEPIAISLT